MKTGNGKQLSSKKYILFYCITENATHIFFGIKEEKIVTKSHLSLF